MIEDRIHTLTMDLAKLTTALLNKGIVKLGDLGLTLVPPEAETRTFIISPETCADADARLNWWCSILGCDNEAELENLTTDEYNLRLREHMLRVEAQLFGPLPEPVQEV